MTNKVPATRARWAVSTIFFLHGLVWGAWVPHVPLAKERLQAGDGVFGGALLAFAVGAVVSMPLAGALIGRFGSARMVTLTGIGFCLAFLGPIVAPTLPLFMLSGFVYGAFIGSMDVSMNAHGFLVEKTLKLPTMSLFHGLFSMGGMVGAFVGAATLSVMSEMAHAGLSVLLSLILLLGASRFLLPTTLDRNASESYFALPTRATVWLGLLCFLALMSEGSVIDWAAIMLRQKFLLDAGTAAIGYALFSGGMGITRLIGDRLRQGFGAVRLVSVSAAITAVAMALALMVPHPMAAIFALAIVGLGLGNVAPVLFAGGGRLEPNAPGRGIAAVTTLGYSGFLAGPPLIGFTAEIVGLPAALGLTVLAATIIALAARAASPADSY